MMEAIRESDWKLFGKIHQSALQRYCDSVLADVAKITGSPEKSSHERYLELFELINKRNREMASVFDEYSRSWAITSLIAMRLRGLIADSDYLKLSEETRRIVDHLTESATK